MLLRRRVREFVGTVALCFAASACSSSSPATVTLPHFNDITTATPEVQTAARAVVRVRTAGQSGSGFFISATGLLLTNNHVLGDPVCAVEGCYVELTQMHQRGEPQQQPSNAFGVPTTVNAGLDMAAVQFYDPNGNQLDTPDFLSIDSEDPASLLNQHVTIVGHPEGKLKKWTDGQVVDADGQWITTTAYTLPGDSGSPILNDQGQVVGLLHRGPTSEDLFSTTGVNMYSVGTASAPIGTVLAAPPSAPVVSTTAPTTKDDFLANDFVFLNAHVANVTVDGMSISAIPILGEACDAALARTDFTSPNDLSNALTPCYQAQTWIDCRSGSSEPYGIVCPAPTEQSAWASRYQSMNQLWLGMNGQPDYGTASFAIAQLQPTWDDGVSAGAQSLQQVLDAASPVLDFELAEYLAAFAIESYGGTQIATYVSNYKQVPHYELQGTYIAYAAGWRHNNGNMTTAQLQNLLKQLYADPNFSVGTRLAIEDYLYQLNAL
jgi:V8-like Glu-specific endopeptidase